MPDAADPALVQFTSDVVAAYMAHNHVPAADVPALIATVHATFAALGNAPEPPAEPAKLTPPVPIKKSVTDDHIVSLEDGKRYQTLKRHLAKLGLTLDAYRQKWGLPHDYPMTAPAYSNKRSALAKQLGLGALRRKGQGLATQVQGEVNRGGSGAAGDDPADVKDRPHEAR